MYKIIWINHIKLTAPSINICLLCLAFAQRTPKIMYVCVCVCVGKCPMLSHFSHVQLFATLWTIAHQAPPSVGIFPEGIMEGLSCPSPGDLPYSGIKPTSFMSPELVGGLFTTNATGKPWANIYLYIYSWSMQEEDVGIHEPASSWYWLVWNKMHFPSLFPRLEQTKIFDIKPCSAFNVLYILEIINLHCICKQTQPTTVRNSVKRNANIVSNPLGILTEFPTFLSSCFFRLSVPSTYAFLTVLL